MSNIDIQYFAKSINKTINIFINAKKYIFKLNKIYKNNKRFYFSKC